MFGIPKVERKVFKRDFLNNVIVVGTYPHNRSCTELRQSLKERYANTLPIQSDNPQQQYKIDIDVKTNQTRVNADIDQHERQLTLRSRNMQKELNLNNNVFQYRENGNGYGTSITFNEAICPVLGYLVESGVELFSRLQLRKINVIAFELNTNNPANRVDAWQPVSSLISSKLIGQYQAMFDVASAIKHHMNTLQLEEDNYLLTIKYGFNVLEKKTDGSSVKGQVILDLEISRQSAIAISETSNELKMMHQELYNAFSWCISEEFVKLLNLEEGVR